MDIHEVKTTKHFINRHVQYKMYNNGIKDLTVFIETMKMVTTNYFSKWLKINFAIKANLYVKGMYRCRCLSGEISAIEIKDKYLQTKNFEIFLESDLDGIYLNMSNMILKQHEHVSDNLERSQWCLNSIVSLQITINMLLVKIAHILNFQSIYQIKKLLIIILNPHDNKCFLWSILAHLYLVEKDPQTITKYESHENYFKKALRGISFPMSVKNIPTFVNRVNKKNRIKGDLSINVYHLDDKQNICPLLIRQDEKENNIDLLLLKSKNNSHYCLIKNLWKLIRNQYTANHNIKHVCRMCMSSFSKKEKLTNHKECCGINKAEKVTLPTRINTTLEFQNYHHKIKIPFVIIADFEYILKSLKAKEKEVKSSTIEI